MGVQRCVINYPTVAAALMVHHVNLPAAVSKRFDRRHASHVTGFWGARQGKAWRAAPLPSACNKQTVLGNSKPPPLRACAPGMMFCTYRRDRRSMRGCLWGCRLNQYALLYAGLESWTAQEYYGTLQLSPHHTRPRRFAGVTRKHGSARLTGLFTR